MSARRHFNTININIMAQNNVDAESQTNIHNEQTPLLNDHQSDHQSVETEPEPEPEPEQKVRRASWYVWRAFWTIVAALLLAAFIKGWVDAGGDVDVGSNQNLIIISIQPANCFTVV